MTQATQVEEVSAKSVVLYMAMELSLKQWKLAFTVDGRKKRQVTIDGGDLVALGEAIERAKEKLGLAKEAAVYSCYEAGRDGFWLHRTLTTWGIRNVVVDPASVEVNRHARRAKTDRLDVQMLLEKLRRYRQGDQVWRVVRVPSEEAEAGRNLHRELEKLKAERGRHTNRLKGLLFTQGIRVDKVGGPKWAERVEAFRKWDDGPLAEDFKGQLLREGERLELLNRQIKALEEERERRVTAADAPGPLAKVQHLRQLKGIGPVAAWVFVMEFFGWREFRNRKEVGALAGLVGTPYASGSTYREQGISKQGNARVRTLAIEIAWLWLRYQPDSALSQWFNERFAKGGSRHRRVGIVALARKLLVALWRYLEKGVVPEGASLKGV